MEKKIERIEAFIRLANNNPNEHEANAAARKACKMIAENNLKVSDSHTINNIKRTTEPDFKSTRPAYTSNTHVYSTPYQETSWVRDFFNGKRPRPGEYKGYPFEKGDWEGFPKDPPKDPKYNSEDERYYKRKAERGFDTDNKTRDLKCSKCNQIKTTIFVGQPTLFICNECNWTDWINRGKPLTDAL